MVFQSGNSMHSFLLHYSHTIPGAKECEDLTSSLGFIQRWGEVHPCFQISQIPLGMLSLPLAQNSEEGNIV